MTSPIFESNWKIVPDDRSGDARFDGLPCPTKKVFDIIGESGMEEIDVLFKEIIRFKKKIFGNNSKSLGFYPAQCAFNTKNQISVACKEDLDKDISTNAYVFPERAVEGNYTLSFSDELFDE